VSLLGTFSESTEATGCWHGTVCVENMKIVFVCTRTCFEEALLEALRKKRIEERIKAGIEINEATDQHEANNLKLGLATLGRVANGINLECPVWRPEAHVHCDDDEYQFCDFTMRSLPFLGFRATPQ
jgi:hypothetical protein